MQSSAKDQVAGTVHQQQGEVKEAAGISSGHPTLEAEGSAVVAPAPVRIKIGQINQVFPKVKTAE